MHSEQLRFQKDMQAIPAADVSKFADRLGVPVGSVVRWREGWTTPHRLLRMAALRVLEEMSDATD